MTVRSLRIAIIGRGPAGLAVASATRDRLPSARIVTFDSRPRWLGDFESKLVSVGAEVLRSSGTQTPTHDAAQLPGMPAACRVDGSLLRPKVGVAMKLWRQHADSLGSKDTVGSVTSIERVAAGVEVRIAQDSFLADAAICCANEMRPYVPPQLRSVAVHSSAISPTAAWSGMRIAVVGGGLAAYSLSLSASKCGAHVTLLRRRPLETLRFTFRPGHLGWRNYRVRHAALTGEDRLIASDEIERVGTVPPLEARLVAEDPNVDVCVVDRIAADVHNEFDLVVAATGFRCTGDSPGRSALESEGVAWRGSYPVLDRVPGVGGIYVCGPLARSVVGPTASQIHGHVEASELIARDLGRRFGVGLSA